MGFFLFVLLLVVALSVSHWFFIAAFALICVWAWASSPMGTSYAPRRKRRRR